jgi:hypothetical protein
VLVHLTKKKISINCSNKCTATKRKSWRKSRNGGKNRFPLGRKNPGKPSTKRWRRENRRETAGIVVEVGEETRVAEGEAAEVVAEDEAADAIETARERIAEGIRKTSSRRMPEGINRQPRRQRTSNRQRLFRPLLLLEFQLR